MAEKKILVNTDGVIVSENGTLTDIINGVECEVVDSSMVERFNINNGVIDEEFLSTFGNGGANNNDGKEDKQSNKGKESSKEDFKQSKEASDKESSKAEEEQVEEKMTLEDLLD